MLHTTCDLAVFHHSVEEFMFDTLSAVNSHTKYTPHKNVLTHLVMNVNDAFLRYLCFGDDYLFFCCCSFFNVLCVIVLSLCYTLYTLLFHHSVYSLFIFLSVHSYLCIGVTVCVLRFFFGLFSLSSVVFFCLYLCYFVYDFSGSKPVSRCNFFSF